MTNNSLSPYQTTSQNYGSVDSDTLTATFNTVDGLLPIDNFTSYEVSSDFFTPADTFRFTLEDDRAVQLLNKIQIGNEIQININGYPQLIGYVDEVTPEVDRNGGKRLIITGRDLLGVMCDAICRPNLSNPATSTIRAVLTQLFSDFGFDSSDLTIDNSADLSLASGGKVGNAVHGKSLRGRISAFNRFLKHQTRAYKEEGYMEYAMRLCKELGLNIKMNPGTKHINVSPPTYDRNISSPFALYHYTTGSNIQNNVISLSMPTDWKKQPSVIIVEMTYGVTPNFSKGAYKIVYVNELVGYKYQAGPAIQNVLPSVQKAIQSYTNSNASSESLNGAAYYMEPNIYLMENFPQILANQPNVENVCRPMFLYDEKAANADEAVFFAQRKMSEAQQKFLTIRCEVKDHSQVITNSATGLTSKMIWEPDMMSNVYDEDFKINGTFWIQKRVFKKSKHGGTTTNLELKLPYVFPFQVVEN